MSCKKNLFTLLGGTPDPSGVWVLHSVPTGKTLPVILSLSLDDITYYNTSVSLDTTIIVNAVPAGSTLWWNPAAGDAIDCNVSEDWVWRYDVDSICGDPPFADVTWSLIKTCEYTAEEIDLCQVNSTYSLLTLLRDAQGIASPNWIPSGGTWVSNYPGDGLDDPIPGFLSGPGTFNPLTAGEGDYSFTYSWDADGIGTCTECEGSQILTIHVLPLANSGSNGTITTCV